MITEHELPCNSLKPHRATGVPFIQQAALSWVSLSCRPAPRTGPYLLPTAFTFILALLGVQIILFTLAITGSCLWFVLETLLITPGWGLSVAEQHLHSIASIRGWSAQELGRTHTWDRWPQLTKRISPHHMVHCSAYRAVEKKKGRCPEWYNCCPQVSLNA